jgi:hypothetical protein
MESGMPHPFLPRALLLGALIGGAAQAQTFPASDPVGLRGDVSGSWYDPAQSGHGLMVEVIDRGRAVVTWYTFDAAGAPLWLSGAGSVQGAVLEVPVSTVSGGRFPPLFNPALVQRQAWGTLRIEFAGCDDATLRWTPTAAGFAAGSMPLKRLSTVQATRCNVEEEFGETRSFAFERGAQGFTPLFADKPPGEESFYELGFAHEPLPAPLQARRGLRLSGNNHSDDLAMLVKAPLGGLRPNQLYQLELELELASDVPAGCAGVGGSPGEGLYMKLGASTTEPLALPSTVPGDNGWLRLNIDYGQQSTGGANALLVGILSNSHSCDDGVEAPWELKTLSTRGQSLRVRSDAQGRLWVVAGSDSAFEGRTDYYFTALRVRLEPVSEG